MKPRMLTPTNLYIDATSRLEELHEKQTFLEERIRKALPGKIHMSTSGNSIYYYHRTDPSQRSGIYIPKHDSGKIRNLLQKSYDEKVLKQVKKEIHSIESFLKTQEEPERIQAIYLSYPEKSRPFLRPLDVSDEEYAKMWLSISYEKNPYPIEKDGFITDKGDQVRSKSELNIANELFKQHIPYKYECSFQLKGGAVIYPDFTILHPHTRKVVYWEHRGMMDDRSYVADAIQRKKDYQLNNIFPGESLILTDETLKMPLGTSEIRRIIAHYFLQ